MLDQPEPQTFNSGPPRPSAILRPGVPLLAPGTERYVVAGGGAVVISLWQGDRIAVTDMEGLQACELVAADAKGRVDPGIIGESSGTIAEGLKAILASGSQSGQAVKRHLERRSIKLSDARGVRLFGTGARAGASAEFTATRDGALIVCAPGAAMQVDAHNTLTPILLMVHRAKVRPTQDVELPDPLGDPLQDIRIATRTAQGFFVRAGEYIQVIDVAGRQCTDFQCFDARKLDQGLDRPLDATTTRTLMAQGYPSPGLFSKGFDEDMTPLVELVQDTCGRHDAFGLACTARYYDDIGYPGHVNCTDNFNDALDEYGVRPRAGWMALNYFYNTAIDDNNVLYLDEPWSRPGDYVLMRALTDLVCVSSACPDDTTAANGWNPTDIHVRTYSDKETYSKAIAFRMTPDAEPELTRETGFHESFSAHTRNFTEYKGFWLANHFNNDGAIAEYWACRERAVVMDLSPLRKFEVTGPDAEALMQYTLTRNVRKLSVGQVVYSAMCYEHGGMLDDGTLFRLGDQKFRWIGGDEYGGKWLREQAEKLRLNAWVRSSTNQMHNIAVQGPKSRDILKEVIWTPPAHTSLEELEWFRFTVGRIREYEGAPVVVSRTGYTGELGYEIWCHPKDAGEVFDAVWEAGEPHGISPLGLEALDMVRIEAGLVFAGNDFCDQTDPFEAGIGFSVALKTKEDDFIGRDALIRRKENPSRKLVGLEIDGNETVGHGDCVHIGRPQIGEVTSATRSPILKKNIALARIDIAHAETGTEVEVGKLDGHQKRLPARIVAFPHYDPKKSRVRA